MRKYYRAALAITAAVSVISLLIYRHEYNKLRYVLEVFNYFGKPGQKMIETNCTNIAPSLERLDLKFQEPISSWQRFDNDLYIYSAYNLHKGEVRAIAFGKININLGLECNIFFPNEIQPTVGNFQYNPIRIRNISLVGNSEFSGYHLICTYNENRVPVGITFLTDSNKHIKNAPIISVTSAPKILNSSNIAICVSPPLIKPLKDPDVWSFLQFHKVIGINNFIVYDFGISNALNKYLKQVSGEQKTYWKFSYVTVPWNFPFMEVDYNVIKDIVEADCLYRTYNKAMYIVTLSWEEYVVLKYHHLLNDLMLDYNKSNLLANSYRLTTQIFCMEQKDDKKFTNLSSVIFRKTHFDPSIPESRSIFIQKPQDILNNHINSREAGKDVIVVNRYQYCYKKRIEQEPESYDPSILRFAPDIQSARLLGKLVSIGLYYNNND